MTRVKEESKKASLKLNIQKTKIMTSGPMANRRGKCGSSDKTSFSWAPKSLCMVTVAMKLKDACSLEEKQ